MVYYLLILSAAVQSGAMPPPSPGPLNVDYQRASIAEDLRRKCMSEEGVAIAIEGWTKSREVASLREAEDLAVTKELADAAYSSPIDVQRLKRAIVAKNAAEASRVDATTKASIDTLDKLSKLDRQIYARRFTHWQSAIPVRECWAKRAK